MQAGKWLHHTVRYRVQSQAFCKWILASNGVSDFRIPYTMCKSFRMAPPSATILLFPPASIRLQKAIIAGLYRLPHTAGMYRIFRSLLLPTLESRVCPRSVPDDRSLGARPAYATSCLTPAKRCTSGISPRRALAVVSATPGMVTNNRFCFFS